MATELTVEEQENVRRALRVLKVRYGDYTVVAARMKLSYDNVRRVASGERPAGGRVAIRVAQIAGASVDDVLAGRYPGPEACRHCGHPFDGGIADTDEQGGSDVH